MRVVAGGTLAILDGLVFYLRFRQRLLHVFMALETKFAVGFYKQLFIAGDVWIVAGSAFPVLDWLVFELRLCNPFGSVC